MPTDPSDPLVINNMIVALLYQDKVKEALPYIKTLSTYPQFSQKAATYRQFISRQFSHNKPVQAGKNRD